MKEVPAPEWCFWARRRTGARARVCWAGRQSHPVHETSCSLWLRHAQPWMGSKQQGEVKTECTRCFYDSRTLEAWAPAPENAPQRESNAHQSHFSIVASHHIKAMLPASVSYSARLPRSKRPLSRHGYRTSMPHVRMLYLLKHY